MIISSDIKYPSLGLAILGAIALTSPNALADEDKTYPRIETNVAIEIQNDLTVDSDDKTAENNDLFNTTEVETGLYFTKNFSLQSLAVLEPVFDPGPNDDRFFEDHGAFLENLFLQFEYGPFSIFAGKFNPSFGIAWDEAHGIYGVDFAEDYELAERIGGGISLTHEGEAGKHVFSANIFRADTTFLSRSIFHDRGRTQRKDGGASNTNGLESVSFTLQGEEIPSLPGFTYHVGFRHQSKGRGDSDNENGFVAGAKKEFDLGNDQAITLVGEGVYLNNAEAGPDDVIYLTGSGEFTSGPWSASLAHTSRITEVAGGGDVNDRLTQVTLGYEIQDGPLKEFNLNVGYKAVREGGIDSHVIGFLVAREFSFSLPH